MGLARKKFCLFFVFFCDDEYILNQKDLEQKASLNGQACVFLLLSYKLSQTFGLEYLINGKVGSQMQVIHILAFSIYCMYCSMLL